MPDLHLSKHGISADIEYAYVEDKKGGGMAVAKSISTPRKVNPVHTVPMPENVAKRPRDSRGYPYLFMLGEEQFRGILPARMAACIRGKLCGICGQPLGYWIAFCGGPQSCENRAFTDPPFHPECAEYAYQVCPYILTGSYDRSTRPDAVAAAQIDPVGTLAAVERMGIYITRSYRALGLSSGAIIFEPAPAKSITYKEMTR
jgi:hypothetical protein